jgi:CRISPR system Cascade subunit CasA
MHQNNEPMPTFNLWSEPWIMLERPEGGIDIVGMEQALLQAQDYTSIYDMSPIYMASIHRLLTAVMQFVIHPQKDADIKEVWRAGHFPPKKIKEFGESYANRFDLFSPDAPFLQSADLPDKPDRESKTVAYLAPEVPAGTNVAHFRHGREDDQVFCPACVARGLVGIPSFATSGGAGIKPSINGVPPTYILPGGHSLFESLAASLLSPEYQPQTASRKKDDAWWVRPSKVGKGKEVREVGYLHSLTFPARQVRVFPEQVEKTCTRCGAETEWGVRRMIFEMGESRSKEAEFWFDPFAAYRIRETKQPTPIRPTSGKAAWREFANLFLPVKKDQGKKEYTVRPAVLEQIAQLRLGADWPVYPFRCVGMRTDMKAKVFEWMEAGFDVPPSLLCDDKAGATVQEAIDLASDCADIIRNTFREYFGGHHQKVERYQGTKNRMLDEYWGALAEPFRRFVLEIAPPEQRENIEKNWADTVRKTARESFTQAVEGLGDEAAALREKVQGTRWCQIRLEMKRKEYLHEI